MSFLARSLFASSSRLSIPARAFSTSSLVLAEGRRVPNPLQSPDFPPIPGSPSTDIALRLSDGTIAPTDPKSSTDGLSFGKDTHEWWQSRSNARNQASIISMYEGRSEPVTQGSAFIRSYRSLKRLMNVSGVKKEVRQAMYYEKPSEKRVRLASERHRRRFAAMVRSKVHLVAAYRNRNK